MTLRDQRQEWTRQTILDEALKLLNEAGLDGFSLRQLAKRVGYSPAALYEYFDNKDEIIEALIEKVGATFTDSLNAVPTDTPAADRMIGLGEAYIAFADEHPDYFIMAFMTMQAGRTEVSVPLRPDSSYRIVIAAAQAGLDSGEFNADRLDVETIAYGLWALVHGMSLLRITHLRDFKREELDLMNRRVLDNYVASLGV